MTLRTKNSLADNSDFCANSDERRKIAFNCSRSDDRTVADEAQNNEKLCERLQAAHTAVTFAQIDVAGVVNPLKHTV